MRALGKACLIMLAVLLTGCLEEEPDTKRVRKNKISYAVVCINGVKYYQGQNGTYNISPVVNAKTLTFESCDPTKVVF